MEAPLTTQRPLKQETGLCHTELKPRKVIDKSSRTMDVKQKRPPEQSDHILRERQRRDDMTSKFAILESLLPIGVKVTLPISISVTLLMSLFRLCLESTERICSG